jgi:hypothetical protein
MDILRRVLARPVSVATLIEISMWLAIPHVLIGATWAATHPETMHALENSWGTLLPAHTGDLATWLGAFVVWPAILLLPTNCAFSPILT